MCKLVFSQSEIFRTFLHYRLQGGSGGYVWCATHKLILECPLVCQSGVGHSENLRNVLHYRLHGVGTGGGVWYALHNLILLCSLICQFDFGQS